jgi:L-asparaginase
MSGTNGGPYGIPVGGNGVPEAIRIIITGGTFDKQYDPLAGTLTFKDTHLPRILETVRCTVSVRLEIIQLIDSLDMSDENRFAIRDACLRSPESRIIVTHGTDTMVRTAGIVGRGLVAAGHAADKTVVLTGAMVPYAVADSDALFNLGCATTAVQTLPPGSYITMNGRIFPYDRVEKDRKRGIFLPKGGL